MIDLARMAGTTTVPVVLAVLVAACAADGGSATRLPAADCADCPRMVAIPAGVFRMGSELGEEGRPEGPVRVVRIARAFAIAETETTVAQFRAFTRATGYRPQQGCRTFIDGAWRNSAAHSWEQPGPGIRYADDSPVVCVSWDDAIAYTGWLSGRSGKRYRLPSEAEWEYAAGSDAATRYFWGDSDADGCRFANMYDESSRSRFAFAWPAVDCDDGWASLSPAASLRANGFGLYDMIGNAWEWVADCYAAPYPDRADAQAAYVAAGVCENRAVRGGGWSTRGSRQRHAFRGRDPAAARMSYFGFRVARDLD